MPLAIPPDGEGSGVQFQSLEQRGVFHKIFGAYFGKADRAWPPSLRVLLTPLLYFLLQHTSITTNFRKVLPIAGPRAGVKGETRRGFVLTELIDLLFDSLDLLRNMLLETSFHL